MLRKYSKIICCIMIFLMTFTGICMDTRQAGLFIEQSALEDHSNSVIISYHSAITSETVCTQKMLGISRSSFIRHVIEHKTPQSKIRGNRIHLVNNFFKIRLFSLHMAKQIVCVSKACSEAVILNYIHDQDGAK